MRVDEARNDNAARNINFVFSTIGAESADDPVLADRDIALHQFAGYKIEEATALEHDIGRLAARALIDHPFQYRFTPFHRNQFTETITMPQAAINLVFHGGLHLCVRNHQNLFAICLLRVH